MFSFLAAILQASSFTLDKVVLSMRRVSYKTYTGISFPLIFLITLGIFFIFRPPLSWALFSGNLWLLVMVLVVMLIITNLIYYRALDDDYLGEIQTLNLLKNIPIIILSSLVFTKERNFAIIIPAFIASLAIIWSHWEHHHFKIKKHTVPFIVWSLLVAPFAAIISQLLLMSWNPISLQLVSSAAVALVLGPLFFRYTKKVTSKAFILLLATNVLTSTAWIFYYFSFQLSGIIYTILIFSLQPLLVYFASIFFLKERIHWKKVVAFGIVLLSIAIAKVI